MNKWKNNKVVVMFGNEILGEESFVLKRNYMHTAKVVSDVAKIYVLRKSDLEKILAEDIVIRQDFKHFCKVKLESLAKRLLAIVQNNFNMLKQKEEEENEIKKCFLKQVLKKNAKSGLIIKKEKLEETRNKRFLLPTIENKVLHTETTQRTKTVPTEQDVFFAEENEKRKVMKKLDKHKRLFLNLVKTNNELENSLRMYNSSLNQETTIIDLNNSAAGGRVYAPNSMKGKKFTLFSKRVKKQKKNVLSNREGGMISISLK